MVLVPPVAMAQGRSGGTPVTGDLSDGGKFKGTLSEPQFSFDEEGQLVIHGVLIGKATKGDGTSQQITHEFEKVVSAQTADATESVSILQAEACDVLFLDIGPIFLDLLGLTVDLSQIILAINAVPGAGNLLGNLLCALLGLLDPQ
jgi:hypothetical protein